jgi:hypothetical protein
VLWQLGTRLVWTYCAGDDDSLASEIEVVGLGAFHLPFHGSGQHM